MHILVYTGRLDLVPDSVPAPLRQPQIGDLCEADFICALELFVSLQKVCLKSSEQGSIPRLEAAFSSLIFLSTSQPC